MFDYFIFERIRKEINSRLNSFDLILSGYVISSEPLDSQSSNSLDFPNLHRASHSEAMTLPRLKIAIVILIVRGAHIRNNV